MADVKISELPSATSIASPDVAPIVQGGVTKQADVSLFNSLKASLILHSAANQTNVPYNFQNAGIVVYDSDNSEIFRLWSSFLSDSIFIGSAAGEATDGTTSESQNTVLGGFAFRHNTDGSDNTAVGFQSLTSNLSGNSNTGIGSNALSSLATGDNNVAVGDSALGNADGISDSVAIGAGVDFNSNKCVVIGSGATGDEFDELVAIGYNANAQGGADAIAIGSGAQTNGENAIAIGSAASASNDNTIVIGNGDITDFYGGNDGQAIFHGLGDAMVFPDSDPHIAGAGYWLAGVLTRSSG